jgi:hypothetical protein
MDPCTLCGGPTAPHCQPSCNRGWVRCRACGAFGRPGEALIPRMLPPVAPPTHTSEA